MRSDGCWPVFENDEIDAVNEILRSGRVNYWTGEQGRLFEKEFAQYHDCKYGIAVANGTVALELALYALGIGPGDDVVTTPKTFLATASSIVMRGAKPVFADVDLVSQNITAESIEKVLTPNTKAIICVHLAGWPCEMDKIMKLAEKRGLYVIEDCAQAHGAEYKGKKVGSWGHINAFSFCQDKIMTTGGEGGMVTTNDELLWQRAWSFKDHGKSYDAVYNKEHPPGFRWLHENFGTNWRMTEMQATIGRCQLKKIPTWLELRRKYANTLISSLKSLHGIRLPNPSTGVNHSYYKFYIVLNMNGEREFRQQVRSKVIEELLGHAVPAFVGSCSEIYLEKCFENSGLKQLERLPNAEYLSDAVVALHIHHNLSSSEIERWSGVLKKVLTEQLIEKSLSHLT